MCVITGHVYCSHVIREKRHTNIPTDRLRKTRERGDRRVSEETVFKKLKTSLFHLINFTCIWFNKRLKGKRKTQKGEIIENTERRKKWREKRKKKAEKTGRKTNIKKKGKRETKDKEKHKRARKEGKKRGKGYRKKKKNLITTDRKTKREKRREGKGGRQTR